MRDTMTSAQWPSRSRNMQKDTYVNPTEKGVRVTVPGNRIACLPTATHTVSKCVDIHPHPNTIKTAPAEVWCHVAPQGMATSALDSWASARDMQGQSDGSKHHTGGRGKLQEVSVNNPLQGVCAVTQLSIPDLRECCCKNENGAKDCSTPKVLLLDNSDSRSEK